MTKITYETWLLIPGNHRLVMQLKKQVKEVLKQPAKIDSWSAIFECFEVVFSKDSTQVQIFNPIFLSNPPSVELGATANQIDLYQQLTDA